MAKSYIDQEENTGFYFIRLKKCLRHYNPPMRYIFMVFFSLSLGFSFSAEAFFSCKGLFKGTAKLQQHQAQYEIARNHYNKLAIRDAEPLLFQRVEEGKNAAIETIAYLDAKTQGNLYSQLAKVLELNTAYRSQWTRWLGFQNQIKAKKKRIKYHRNFYQQGFTNQFVKDLLRAFYKVEIRKSKDRLFLFRTKHSLKEIENLDRFFYENEGVIQRFGRYELNDYFSLTDRSVTSMVLRFFTYSDPVMQHRVNQFDLRAYNKGNLKENLQRLKTSIRMYSGQRKLLWASLLASPLLLPYYYTTNRTSIEVSQQIGQHIKENSIEIQSRMQDNFNRSLELIYKREHLKDLIEKSKSPEEKQVYQEELRLVVERLKGRPDEN